MEPSPLRGRVGPRPLEAAQAQARFRNSGRKAGAAASRAGARGRSTCGGGRRVRRPVCGRSTPGGVGGEVCQGLGGGRRAGGDATAQLRLGRDGAEGAGEEAV